MRVLALSLAAALGACSVGPDFTPPQPPDVAKWNDRSVAVEKTVTTQSNPDPKWWRGFQDPMLSAVIDKAISGNLDLQQAVMRVIEAQQNETNARAAGLPSVTGTGSYMREQLGLRATDASYLTNWASNFYSFGPSISLPIFQGGRLTAGLRLARAQEAEAALAYRGTVLNALREVEDALVAYRTDLAARDKLDEAVRSGEMALYLARDRYSHGLADFLQVLDAERTVVGSRQQLVQADVTLTNDVVALYSALGGGWEDDGGRNPAPSIETAPPLVPGALDALEAKLQ